MAVTTGRIARWRGKSSFLDTMHGFMFLWRDGVGSVIIATAGASPAAAAGSESSPRKRRGPRPRRNIESNKICVSSYVRVLSASVGYEATCRLADDLRGLGSMLFCWWVVPPGFPDDVLFLIHDILGFEHRVHREVLFLLDTIQYFGSLIHRSQIYLINSARTLHKVVV